MCAGPHLRCPGPDQHLAISVDLHGHLGPTSARPTFAERQPAAAAVGQRLTPANRLNGPLQHLAG
jgi:hypothetical protein